jgi:hypothetical protein
LDDENDQCEHQQNVDESTQCVAADETEQPQDQEDYKDCPEHFLTLPKTLHILTTKTWTSSAMRLVVRGTQNKELKTVQLRTLVGHRFAGADNFGTLSQWRYSAKCESRI